MPGPLVKSCHFGGLLGLQPPACCRRIVPRALLHPLLCQLKGKVVPAARGHRRFLTATTKLQESTCRWDFSVGWGGRQGWSGLPQTVLPALPSSGSELTPRHLLLWALWLLLPSRGRERHEVGLAQPALLVDFIPDPLGPQLFLSQHGRGCAGRKRHFQQGVTPSSLSPRKGSSSERRQGFRHLLWSLCYPPPSQLSKLQP